MGRETDQLCRPADKASPWNPRRAEFCDAHVYPSTLTEASLENTDSSSNKGDHLFGVSLILGNVIY